RDGGSGRRCGQELRCGRLVDEGALLLTIFVRVACLARRVVHVQVVRAFVLGEPVLYGLDRSVRSGDADRYVVRFGTRTRPREGRYGDRGEYRDDEQWDEAATASPAVGRNGGHGTP